MKSKILAIIWTLVYFVMPIVSVIFNCIVWRKDNIDIVRDLWNE